MSSFAKMGKTTDMHFESPEKRGVFIDGPTPSLKLNFSMTTPPKTTI